MKEAIEVGPVSDSSVEELAPLLGRELIGINSQEYTCELRFSGGWTLTLHGSRWDGCALGVVVELEEADVKKP